MSETEHFEDVLVPERLLAYAMQCDKHNLTRNKLEKRLSSTVINPSH